MLFVDIHGTSATEVGVKLDCSSKKPCTGIRLEDVKLTYRNKPAASACTHAGGIEAGFFQPNCLTEKKHDLSFKYNLYSK